MVIQDKKIRNCVTRIAVRLRSEILKHPEFQIFGGVAWVKLILEIFLKKFFYVFLARTR